MTSAPVQKKSGSTYLACIGLVISAGLLLGGGRGIYIALKNREPLKMTFKEYQEKRPPGEWISLSDSQLNLFNCAYITSKADNKIKAVYITVEPAGDRDKKPALMLLASEDKNMIALVEDLGAKMNAVMSPSDLTPELLQSLLPVKEVSGMVESGINSDRKTRNELAKLDISLEKDFLIIREGRKPQLGRGVEMLGAGLLLGFFLLRRLRKKSAAPLRHRPLCRRRPICRRCRLERASFIMCYRQ